MVENGSSSENNENNQELLFFDTFSHDIHEKLNLDLVQFPRPVYISEVRIIPLGARVQADFPGGGVRLGATNPSQFEIEFFVNDLSISGASTFECLGGFAYNQNECINLECKNDEIIRKIPTDGLVLKGWYTTVTLAVYGNFTYGNIPEVPIPSNANANNNAAVVQVSSNDNKIYENFNESNEIDNGEIYNNNFQRGAHHNDFLQDQNSSCDPTVSSTIADDLKDDEQPSNNSPTVDYIYSRSPSKDQEKNNKREWSNSPEGYRHSKRSRVSGSYDNNFDDRLRDRELRRKPRTPPLQSPRISRPRSPTDSEDDGKNLSKNHSESTENDSTLADQSGTARAKNNHGEEDLSTTFCPSSPSMANNTPIESPIEMEDDGACEQFEPILSDDDISDDPNCLDDLNDELFAEEFLIKTFNPFVSELKKVNVSALTGEDGLSSARLTKINENLLKLSAFYNETYRRDETTMPIREDWVKFCEQLIQTLRSVNNYEFRDKLMESVERSVLEMFLFCIQIGLNYDLAIQHQQAGYNLRHIKAGIRLSECLASYGTIIEYIIVEKDYDIFKYLFDLIPLEFIPMPIKLLIAKLIYHIIDTKQGVERFLKGEKFNGYHKTITMLNEITDIRLLFTLKAILKKVHVYETLENIKNISMDVYRRIKDNEETETYVDQVLQLEGLFRTLLNSRQTDNILYTQPKRFLPIATQFEIVNSEKIQWQDFVSFYKVHNFLEITIMLLNIRHSLSSTLLILIIDYLKVVINNSTEFAYISEDIVLSNNLIKMLLQSQEHPEEISIGLLISANENLNIDVGLEIAYKIETKFHLDMIINSDDNDLADSLHSIFNLCVSPGRKFVLETICKEDNIMLFLNLIDNEKKISMKVGSPGFKLKSPILSYAVDILDYVVRNVENLDYLKQCDTVLLNLVKHHDCFEPSVAAMLQEMSVFLKPLEIEKVFSYNDIIPLVELIKRSMEFITTFPGDLIMSLRILRYLTISEDHQEYQELKYKYFIIQFYSTDGITMLIAILEKLTSYYDQPMMHSYLLATNQGSLLMQVIYPAIQILQKILFYVIRARNVDFKDITAIETLLKTYTLMHSFNARCPMYKEAKCVQSEVIKILKSYTQSLSPESVTTGNIHKSLWTQMIGEVIKYAINGPYHFIPGLTVLTELLPIPLPVPIQSKEMMTKQESIRLITERQLWSAHLHPQSQLIVEMLKTVCTTTNGQLLEKVFRLCIQLSDLAPNMTLLVAKLLLEMILAETSENNEATPAMARLLRFLAMLMTHCSIKVSILSILSGKMADLLLQILTTVKDQNDVHVQAQDSVFLILQNLFDCQISMLYNSKHNPELILASGLPSKELMVSLTNAVLENFIGTDLINLSLSAIRTCLMLTEHDITVAILKSTLLNKRLKFVERLQSIGTKTMSDRKQRILIPEVLELFRALAILDPHHAVSTSVLPRTRILTPTEFYVIFNWNNDLEEDKHFLGMFKRAITITDVEVPLVSENGEAIEIETENYDQQKEDLEYLLNMLRECKSCEPGAVSDSLQEFNLPQAEGIVTQFSLRVCHTISDNLEELNENYWLHGYPYDEDTSMDQVECDLSELVRTYLPPDTNISSDCKRLLNLSSSPQATRDRAQSGICFRTRRVEVEPATGRPEKKIYGKFVPRGRGFSRGSAIRGDIFRSRPPNTSRPPSLHVDDFLAMESGGGNQGYNKREIISVPRGRGRGSSFIRGRGVINSTWQSTPRTSHDGTHHYNTHHYREPAHFTPRGRVSRGRYRGYPR